MIEIIVVSNLKPWKTINNRYRVLSATGVCATLNASDYKDARCVIVKRKVERCERSKG